MTEERGWYLTELGERATTIHHLRDQLRRWQNRVRELEDAILIHDRDRPYPDDVDRELYRRMGETWT